MKENRGNSFPENDPNPENNPDDKSGKKKKRSKKASDFGVHVARLEENTKKAESKPKERTSFEEALVELVISEPKKPDAKSEAKDKEAPVEDSAPEPEEIVVPEEIATEPENSREPHDDDPAETAATDEAQEVYEDLPNYEPKPTEFSGGEVVIDLSGQEPVAERVVLLHDAAEADAPSEAEAPAEQAPVSSWQQLPEQQQQARHIPQGAETPYGQPAEAPSVPPEPAETRVNPMPEQVPVPATEVVAENPEIIQPFTGRQYNVAPYVQNGEQVATKQDVEDAIYYATKSGQQRGLVAGLLVGAGYEHFKHRRREKKAEKRFKKQGRQLEEARQDYHFGQQEQERRQTEATARLTAAEHRFSSASPEVAQSVEAGKQPEKLIIRTPEQLVLPPEHTLQRSAWHSIEVDTRTGKAVENPTFEYGQEFHKERAKESLPEDSDLPTAGVAKDLVAAAQIPNASTDASTVPPANLPNATVQGPPSSPTDKAKKALQSLAKSDNPVSSGPIWPWLLALLVIVVLLAVLL